MTEQTTSEKLAKNVAIILAARAAMIFAASALPVFGWFMVRAINTVDTISENISTIKEQQGDTSANIKLLQQSLTGTERIVVDHEGRIRILENYARNSLPNASAVPR